MEKAGDQVPLLKATRERVVSLAPPVPVTATSSEGNMTESIDRLFDEGNGAEKEHSTGGGEYVALTEAIVEPVNEDVAEKPRRLKKKRKAARDASGSTLPPKKLREDYGTSGASASTGRKSRAAMQSLLDNSKLTTEIGVTAAATVPLVTSYVTPMPERKGGDHTASISGPNLRTKPAAVRFVISSDSSHHSGTHAMDVEVSSLVRFTVLDPPGDDHGCHHYCCPSSPVHPELSANSFYAIQDLNPKTLHRDFYTKFYNSLGRAPNRCSSSIGKTPGVVIVYSGNRLGRLDQGLTEF
ncbi:hypothetical protein Tco_0713896 [Tanacetum coccineum]